MDQRLFTLHRNNIFYRCVEDSNEAIMVTDRTGVLLYVNKAWQMIYQFTAEEAIGQTPRMLRSRHQGDSFYKDMWKQILDPKIGFWRGELTNLTKDGKEVPIILTITPYRDANGEVQGYMGIAIDMTEKKQLEAQVLQQDRLASVGLLASGLAHEIGTPLGVVRGRAEYLINLAKDDEKIKSGLNIIVTQIDRISKLIYTLLNLARPDREVRPRSVDLSKNIESVEALIHQELKQANIQWINNTPADAFVLAEPDRLTQVFLNLAMNAIHAIQTRIKKDSKTPRKITLSATLKEKVWEITLEDTGCGISKENMNNLFKPFFTTKAVGEGTGLGLAVILQIIQSWGGSISAESTEHKGTQFILQIPKAN